MPSITPITPPDPPAPVPLHSETQFRLSTQLRQYCLGMLGIAVLGFALGFVFPWLYGVVYATTDSLSYLAVFPFMLFQIGFWGIVTYGLYRFSKGANRVSMWIYGVAGYGLGMFFGLNSYELTPGWKDFTDISFSFRKAALLALGLAIVYAAIYGCQQVAVSWLMYRRQRNQFRRRQVIFCCCALALLLTTVLGVLAGTRPGQHRSIHLPNSSLLIANPELTRSVQHPNSQVYTIYYRQQSKKLSPYGDTLTVQRQSKASDDVAQSCKAAHNTAQSSPDQQYTYKHLSDGFMYGEAAFQAIKQVSITPNDTVVFSSRPVYCFVISGFVYTLQQDDTTDKRIAGELAFAKGPKMIQAIREAPIYLSGCSNYFPVQDGSSTYCPYSEIQRYHALQDDAAAAIADLTSY